MVSVGGRDVCWWEWSVIVAAFEPDGEAGRKGWEESKAGGIGRGTWPCVQPTTGGGTPRHFYHWRAETLQLGSRPTLATRRVDSKSLFIMNGGTLF